MQLEKARDYLSKSEYLVLRTISEFKERYGYAPTVQELSQQCFLSKSYVYEILRKLEKYGFVRSRTKTVIVIE